MFLDFIEPDRNALEALSISKIEYDNDSISSLVVRICDGSVSLLPCSVPNLEFDGALIDLKGAESKVDSDRADVVLLEAVILSAKAHEPSEQQNLSWSL